jgi:hypothetical protein
MRDILSQSVPRVQLTRTVLQQDYAMSAFREAIRQTRYLAFLKLASIRIWLHANESAP